MKKIFVLISYALLSIGARAQAPFAHEIAPSFTNPAIRLDCRQFASNSPDYSNPNDFVDVLAISGDCTVYDPVKQTFAPMKGNISAVYLLQDGTTGAAGDSLATVYATIDKNQKDGVLGDGGGLITFTIQRSGDTGEWQVISTDAIGDRLVYFTNVDFSTIGGTVSNQDFTFTGRVNNTTQRFLITENVENIHSNDDLTGFSDLSDYTFPTSLTQANPQLKTRTVIPAGTTLKKYQSLGWPVQIDGVSGQAKGKFYRLGRGVTAITTDGVGLFFVYGGNPSVLMSYGAPGLGSTKDLNVTAAPDPNLPDDDGSIYLYAYKQNEDGSGGFSIPICFSVDSVVDPDAEIPGTKKATYAQIFDSLLVAKDVALRAGATMFANIGDLEYTFDDNGNGILLLTEKGIDDSGDAYSNAAKKYNGELAAHLKAMDANDGTTDNQFKDPFGRILALSTTLPAVSVVTLTEGGQSKDGGYFFSNPDKLELESTNSDIFNLLIRVNENIPATTLGRNPSGTAFENRVNEAYYIDVVNDFEIVPGLPSTTDNNGNPVVTPIPFSSYSLYESGSNGSMLTSSGKENLFTANRKRIHGQDFDSYLTVVNGYNGTDKSYVLAVRNIYSSSTECLPDVPLGFFGDPERDQPVFKAWPNPTNGLLYVSESSNYTISDVAGAPLKSFSQTTVLDLTGLDKGVYFVKNAAGAVRKVILD